MKRKLLTLLWAGVLPLLVFTGCRKNTLTSTDGSKQDVYVSKLKKTLDLDNPTSIFIGSAFKMETMAYQNAALWATDAAYGVGLHVHPVGWRNRWDELGPPIAANLVNKNFVYEMDIVDPRGGDWDNVAEVQKMISFGLTCARVTCNVDTKELDMNPNLPTELMNTVIIPFNQLGIPVDILFSPCSPTALEVYNGETHIQRLLNNSRWTNLLFNQAHAQGVALDFPLNYYPTHKQKIVTILQQTITSAHEATWMINCSPPVDNVDLIPRLSAILSEVRSMGIAPKRWICNQFGDPNFAPVAEMNPDGSPQYTAAGAALFLARNTLASGGVTEIFRPELNRYYKITGKQSGKCLDVAGVSTADNAQIHIWGYVGGANQQWKFVPASNGYYKIVSRNSGKLLSAATTANANQINIVQLTDTNGTNQQWKIVYVGDGFKFVNLGTGKDLDVQGFGTADGTNVWTWDYLNGDNQKWFFTPGDLF
jgi:hypothetical protein